MTNHYGDNIHQYGNGNIGKIVGVPPEDVGRLLAAAQTMRSVAAPARREEIGQALETVRSAGTDPGRLRPALENLRGLAAAAGSVGVPVIVAVRKVMEALNG